MFFLFKCIVIKIYITKCVTKQCWIEVCLLSFLGPTNKQITVNIMSLDDGRQTLVQTAQHLCEQVLQRQTKVEDIDYSVINKFYQGE